MPHKLAAGLVTLAVPVLATIASAQAQPVTEPIPESLASLDVRDFLPGVGRFVKDEAAARRLGKALFWDMQVGSDGQACASCHFHAGADDRARNQVSPAGAPPADAADPPRTDFFGGYRPNDELTPADFPLPAASDDVVSSQGVIHARFGDQSDALDLEAAGVLAPGVEIGTPLADAVFVRDGLQVRRVEPRNTPTVINAVFNLRNFWDGRANFIFNGVNPFGNRDKNARVLVHRKRRLRAQRVSLDHSSLASQAVGPPLSVMEMSFVGRSFPDIGKKLLPRRPLARQRVHPRDSLLGGLARTAGGSDRPGLETTYEDMVREAFRDRYWSWRGEIDGYRHMERNFALFFGISVMLYEATLVSDRAPFDRWREGSSGAMTARQIRGLDVFMDGGKCVNCHGGPEFTKAASHLSPDRPGAGPVERMRMGDEERGPALYDNGFYNIGVRPTADDVGVGAEDPFGNPLSFTRQYVKRLLGRKTPDRFEVDPCTFEARFDDLAAGLVTDAGDDSDADSDSAFRVVACDDGTSTVIPTDARMVRRLRTAADGAFKVPTLRNVELTGPYFHNGGKATLMEVVEFYDRGGDFARENAANLDPDITALGLGDDDKRALVDFLIALTDPRVAAREAPFDHPELFVPDGHDLHDEGDGVARSRFRTIEAVGADGRLLDGSKPPALEPFLGLDPFD